MIRSTPRWAAAALCFACLPDAARATAAHSRHRHRPSVLARQAPSYYPENVEGGVPGNLSFNNQLRKLSDPLNANGGK